MDTPDGILKLRDLLVQFAVLRSEFLHVEELAAGKEPSATRMAMLAISFRTRLSRPNMGARRALP